MHKQNESRKKASRQKEGTARKRVAAVDSPSTGGQNITTSQSEGTGVQRLECHDSGVSEWGDRSECDHKLVDANLGKVLEHLGNLESRFYSYVHAHQERLDARRKESENAELAFQQEAQELRDKILSLVGEAEVTASSPETTETEETD